MRHASLLRHWTMQEHALYNVPVIETLPSEAYNNEPNPLQQYPYNPYGSTERL